MVREWSRCDAVGLARRPKFRRFAQRDSHGRGRVSARVWFSGSTARQTRVFVLARTLWRANIWVLRYSVLSALCHQVLDAPPLSFGRDVVDTRRSSKPKRQQGAAGR